MRLRLEALEDRTLLSSISGTVFNDLNGDGSQEPGEPGLQNWEVDRFQGQTLVQAVLTDANGNFSFSNLGPGTFTIQEVVEPGWLRTSTPATYLETIPSGGGDVSGLSDHDHAVDRSAGFSAARSGATVTPTRVSTYRQALLRLVLYLF